jgi:uncharacterized Ntn-hydrolase superfamily protein
MRLAANSGKSSRPPCWSVHRESFAYVDLRVDLDRAPLAQLRYQWEFDKPMLQRYVDRVIDPDSVPYPEV